MTPDFRPLILTAVFEPAFQSRLEGWRRAHYSPRYNRVPAHLSLFRQLPASAEAELRRRLSRLAADVPPLPARPLAFAAREGGVVLEVQCSALLDLREDLAAALAGLIVGPDVVMPRLKVTLQNKADAAAQRASLAALRTEALPAEVRITRLRLWRYLDGPWDLLVDQPFRGRWRG